MRTVPCPNRSRATNRRAPATLNTIVGQLGRSRAGTDFGVSLPAHPGLVQAGDGRSRTFHSFGAGGVACSGVSVVPLSSSTPTQSPAHSFVPRTVPTSLQAVGSFSFTRTGGLLPTLGGAL